MTTARTAPRTPRGGGDLLSTIGGRRPYRWRLNRAGIFNVWFYYDQEFEASGGRLILRGTNGAGKSRAMELLLPYVLDADRRKVDATGSGQVQLKELMATGHRGNGNRLGYVWVELARALDPADPDDSALLEEGATEAHLTAGAAIRYARATDGITVWYFLTPQRVGEQLALMAPDRSLLSVKELQEALGDDHVTQDVKRHQDRVAHQVFGLTGPQARHRFAGLRLLLHTLRAPDVGNRIEQGSLSDILTAALPPLSESALQTAGEKLDGLTETRAAQERLERACQYVEDFVTVYVRYAVGLVKEVAHTARTAAGHSLRAEEEVSHTAREQQRLEDEQNHAAERQAELAGYADELAATISGIKESDAYRESRDLEERQAQLAALATAAEASLGRASAARAAEQDAVASVDEAVEALVDLSQAVDGRIAALGRSADAAGMSAPALTRLAVTAEVPRALSELVRSARLTDPEATVRPRAGLLHPDGHELRSRADRLKEEVRRLVGEARGRHDMAKARLHEAHEQNVREERAKQSERSARTAAEWAVSCEEEARSAADQRDDCAVDLARQWEEYGTSEATRRLLGEVDWSATAVGELLADPTALCGPEQATGDTAGLPSRLDRVAAQVAGAGRARLAGRVATVEGRLRDISRSVQALRDERADLQAAKVMEPPGPPWQAADVNHLALWRMIDFASSLDVGEQAGVEAALLASGLLTGLVCEDGSVRAADGQVLLLPSGPVVLRSIRRVLDVAADCPVPVERVWAVLDRVALGSSSGQPTWIDMDGSWGNGPLHGRLEPPAHARHIGAAARAAARQERLSALADELGALEEDEHNCQVEQAELAAEQQALEDHVAAAPICAVLVSARQHAEAVQEQAVRARQEGARAAARAGQDRRDADAALASHQESCRALSLPADDSGLREVQEAAGAVLASCDALLTAVGGVEKLVARHSRAVEACDTATTRRIGSEQQASAHWLRWSQEDAALAALRESLGETAEQVARSLDEAQGVYASTRAELSDASRKLTELAAAAATARAATEHAEQGAALASSALEDAASRLRRHLSHPALACAYRSDVDDVELVEEAAADEVDRVATAVSACLKNVAGTTDATVVLRAQSVLERSLTGMFDLVSSVDSDRIHVVELIDTDGHRPIGQAAQHLAELRDLGRQALTEREREAFQDFVVNGLAQSLSHHIDQATGLVKNMNASLGSISTSNGIGVTVNWELTDKAGPEHDIVTLARLSPAVMRQDQADQLVALLRDLVEAEFTRDPTAGYTAHLRNALDYRRWHTVQVVVTGPEPEQKRTLNKTTRGRVKLSQGETRFVSYVTLFAAVDAYLSGQGNHERALRLLLLDDAFAKVDTPTVGELLSLLVRLDIDFVMTGHSLWGFFPTVPVLDSYEVRRTEGKAAVTRHVHWDGHHRHIRTDA